MKNFKTYLKKILHYAKAIRVKVSFIDNYIDDGVYMSHGRKIVLDGTLEDKELIAILLHELGHELDASLRPPVDKKIDNAYVKVYKNKATRNQINLVLKTERRAWSYGKVIAKKLGIPLNLWYYETMTSCIKSYKIRGNK